MEYPDITELFIYYREPKKALEIVASGLMECPRASTFNDPFDCTIPFTVDYSLANYLAAFARKRIEAGVAWPAIVEELRKTTDIRPDGSVSDSLKDRIDQGAKRMKEENENLGVLCFTSNPISVLMWSHYGGKHKGICLGFKREPSNILGEIEACSPVRYSDEYPDVSFTDILKGDGKFTEAILFTKAREWAYEKEWRSLVTNPDIKYKIPAPFSRVIVGCNAESDTTKQCVKEGSRLAIPVYKAHRVDRKFELRLEEIK